MSGTFMEDISQGGLVAVTLSVGWAMPTKALYLVYKIQICLSQWLRFRK